MPSRDSGSIIPALKRFPTRVPGLDVVLGGGFLTGDAYLIAGKPGNGKTTLGNHLAFAHAAAGGRVLVATLLTESHDRMLAHLHGFAFADHRLIGERVSYVSLLHPLEEDGVEGALRVLLETIRDQRPSLLVVDGAGAAEMFVDSPLQFVRFIHGLQTRGAVFDCTTVLLSGEREAAGVATHVDGVIELTNTPAEAHDVRRLRVSKLRGSSYLNGYHHFAIGPSGVTVFPRLEAVQAQLEAAWSDSEDRLGFGIAGLDAMLDGGLAAGGSTLVLGPPGSGKTLAGLHFLAEGARHGERGLIASFQETGPALITTADRAGMELGSHIASGLVRTLWRPSLELIPDDWAWQLLAIVDEHRPRRLVIDALSDLLRHFTVPARRSGFATALANYLRSREVTTLFLLEVDDVVGPSVTIPVPNLSAAMDNGILLRPVELRSALHRLVSVLKERETGFDPTMREFMIGPEGIVVGDPFDANALLTGNAVPHADGP